MNYAINSTNTSIVVIKTISQTFNQGTANHFMALNAAAALLYSLIVMVFLILTLLIIVAVSINRKTKLEPENKYTSFINLRKSKDSGQYRYLLVILKTFSNYIHFSKLECRIVITKKQLARKKCHRIHII